MKIGKYCHIKTGNVYEVLDVNVTNASNNLDGQEMVLYSRNGKTFVREKKEFIEKFVKLEEPTKLTR